MDNYIEEIRIQLENSLGIKLNARDTQAVLWYFEQGLYTKLGVKSEPKSYADAAKTIIERKANDIEGGFSQSNVGNVESKKNKNKKRYIVNEDLDLDTGDLYGIDADEIDEFNKGVK
tara:strand:- start:386 stop:736 length:351 start_codon:yes stop_codon:yes gene_type:complete